MRRTLYSVVGMLCGYCIVGVGLVASWQLGSVAAVEAVTVVSAVLTAVLFANYSTLSICCPGRIRMKVARPNAGRAKRKAARSTGVRPGA